MGIELNTDQVYALYSMENWWNSSTKQLFEISGPPGSGKTFLIKYFIERIGLDLSDVAFIAYSGKAAMQMAKTGLPAQTIHSLIYDIEKIVCTDENGDLIIKKNGKPLLQTVFVLKDKLAKKVKLIVLDEASFVNGEMAKDILSFNIPVIALGDLNQLPPIYGKPFFLNNPDYILTKIMRQAEGDPIVYLSQRVIHDEPLKYGVYRKSSVIRKSDLTDYQFLNNDTVITCTNALRHQVNNLFREQLLDLKRLDMLNVGEKIICTQNNRNKVLDGNLFLANGLIGNVTYIDMQSYDGKSMLIDFKPDFVKNKRFKNLKIDMKHLFKTPEELAEEVGKFSYGMDRFEFAYAITCHKMQGSQSPKVLFLDEPGKFDKDTHKRLIYTAISRASESITVVL